MAIYGVLIENAFLAMPKLCVVSEIPSFLISLMAIYGVMWDGRLTHGLNNELTHELMHAHSLSCFRYRNAIAFKSHSRIKL